MCTRYVSPEDAAIERFFHIGARTPAAWARREMFLGYQGPFIRAARDETEPVREVLLGQWNLIPDWATGPKLQFATHNARAEELEHKASFKRPWARGQRCIIPAESFIEPCWEGGKHVPWRFKPAAGGLWGIAGLWNTWVDKSSGEIYESWTMLTLNADKHPLMSRMHRPDPKRPPHMQDKRSLVLMPIEDVDQWLYGPVDQAKSLLRLPSVEWFDAGPAVASSAEQVDIPDE